MSSSPTPRGPKWTIRLLSLVLFFLFASLLSFVLEDIGDMEGPVRRDFEKQQVEAGLEEHIQELQNNLQQGGLATSRQEEIQRNLKASMEVARETMQQMAELHRLSLERNINPSEEQTKTLGDAQTRFIESQAKFESANQTIAELNAEVHGLQAELTSEKAKLHIQQIPGRLAWEEAWKAHNYEVATFKLLFIVPMFLFGAWLMAKNKGSAFRPIFLAVLTASFWHLGKVMHDHFPEDFFKYIAIAAGIVIVLAFLTHILRSMASPKAAALLSRRRESYHRRQCPECAYPYPADHGTEHHCPSCGVTLFAACGACGNSRHCLLPHCTQCGAEAA